MNQDSMIANSNIKAGTTKASDLMQRIATMPNWSSSCPPARKHAPLRSQSSPGCTNQDGLQSSLGTPSALTVADPTLTFLEVRQILLQKITHRREELTQAFQLLDPALSGTVTRNELRRVISTFLLPLTREQFQDVLDQMPLTSSRAVRYPDFLSRFGGLDLQVNGLKRGEGGDRNYSRTLKELESQAGEKILRNIKTISKAFRLLDVNRTGLVRPEEMRRVVQTFCLQMGEDEYRKFARYYHLDKEPAVDYSAFLKNLSINNGLNLRYNFEDSDHAQESPVRGPSRTHTPASPASEDVWKTFSLDRIEKIFCQELAKSRERVEKALSAGDPTGAGHVSLDYLKIVLDAFVYRMPRRVFIKLMRRLGLKTTTKIDWRHFMSLFSDPHSLKCHSATPLTPSSSGSSFSAPVPRLLRQAGLCPRLRKALISLHTTPSGRITGEELRRVLEGAMGTVREPEFQELTQALDPGGTGALHVAKILELLEDSARVGKAPSPSSDARAESVLDWAAVEGQLRSEVTEKFQECYDRLRSHDPGDTGLISRPDFKAVLSILCPSLTADHFLRLSRRFLDSSGRVLYKKFLVCTGQALSPAPADRPGRAPPPRESPPATGRDEVKQLDACNQQQGPALRERILDPDGDPSSGVGTPSPRKAADDSGAPPGHAVRPSPPPGPDRMSFLQLAPGSEDDRPCGLYRPPPAGVHWAGDPDQFYISAEECLEAFPQRVREHYGDPYAAFFRMDADRDGVVNMHDLHKLLMCLTLHLTQAEFLRFLQLLGLGPSLTLNFREFRSLCEPRPPSRDAPPQRTLRQKQKVVDTELACGQAHEYLVTKARTRWSDLSKNFLETDAAGNGILRRRDIRNALYGFAVPLTPREFEKLWSSYDTQGRGHITYQEFLQKLGVPYNADVHRPYATDFFNFMGHFTKPQQIQEETKELQQRMASKAEPLGHRLQEHRQDICKALGKLDRSKTGGLVSLVQLQELLQEGGCTPREEELTQLLTSWGVSWSRNAVNYLDFLKALENSRPATPEPRDGQQLDFTGLDPEDIVKNVQQVVAAAELAMATAFLALDSEDSGFVKDSDFGQVLKDFCPNLSENQYHYFLRKLRLHLTPSINWKYFLQNFSNFLEESAAEWAEKMPRDPRPASPRGQAHAELLGRLRRAVAAHAHAIAQELENFDTAGSGTVSRDEFRAVCSRHVQALTDEQFDRLWADLPLSSKGRLKYQDFLRRFGSDTPLHVGDSTRAQRGSSGTHSLGRSVSASPEQDPRAGLRMHSDPGSALSAASLAGSLQNCEPLESRLRRKMRGCWREFLKDCKDRDADRRGHVSTADFLALVEKYGLDLSTEEAQQLAAKYDFTDSGRFSYCDFIQSCVLLLRARETSLMQRMKIQNAHKMKEAGAENSSLYCALLRIQPKVLHCWRPMRRTFKSYDQNGSGFLSVGDFRKVLRQYSINLSEEEFFHVLEYYDRALSSLVPYNDFLRAFLQ
ncbi:EF-hand calcium-binding domain-containing protein 6 [Sorex araneus]|uniref:EF-hand calcium-binding domain-containing protein 6 n=1 Tax=Sorex araneus TaxID=42254 RepID=UPI002433FA2D|nr:EF-hand calcium-binding domain-containing protein 6 [Sorex araneus]